MSKTNITNLSREQKLELITLLEEKNRREALIKPTYIPHPGQLKAHSSKAKIRFVTSGNGWGKSTFAVQEAFWRANGYNPITKEKYPTPIKVGVLMDKPSKFEEVFLQEARKWFHVPTDSIKKLGKPHISQIQFENGSTITFFSHDQDPLTFESTQYEFWVADEPFAREIYIGMRRSMRRKGFDSKMVIIGTPIGQPWMKEELWDVWERNENPEIECFRGDTEQNEKNLAEGYLASFSKVLSEAEKNVRLHGGWFNAGGFALAHLFNRSTHVLDRSKFQWDSHNPCVIAIDCHVAKKHTALLLGTDRDGYLYVLEEYASKAVARDFAKELIGKGWFNNYRLIDIIYDSLGNTDTTSGEGFKSFGVVFNEVLTKHNLGRARATTYEDKSEEDFISRIQDSLLIPTEPNNVGFCIPKLRVLSNCSQTIKEIETVQWEKNRGMDDFKPRLAFSSKDMIAALKYALATNLYFQKNKDKIFYRSKPAYGVDLTPKRSGKMVFGSRPRKP